MVIYSIGFAQKSAEEFFNILRANGIRQLLDVRLNNISQLAGFSKKHDLEFFLREICGAKYIHEPLLAPTQEMLDEYKKEKRGWATYEAHFRQLLNTRHVEKHLDRGLFRTPTVLLCSEPTANHCHRRLVLEHLQQHWGGVEIRHL